MGSPANVQGLDSVPAPQSQKNLRDERTERYKESQQFTPNKGGVSFHLPIMPNKLYIMSLVTFLNAVHTDGIAVCCVAGVTSNETKDQ